jgi:hypothetical protein
VLVKYVDDDEPDGCKIWTALAQCYVLIKYSGDDYAELVEMRKDELRSDDGNVDDESDNDDADGMSPCVLRVCLADFYKYYAPYVDDDLGVVYEVDTSKAMRYRMFPVLINNIDGKLIYTDVGRKRYLAQYHFYSGVLHV